MAVKAAGELARDESLQLSLGRAAREAARDEERLVAGRDPQPLELVDDGSDRELARVGGRARDGQRGRLDDDGGPRPASHERLERLTFEREPERVAHRSADVRHRRAGRRRAKHDRVVRRRRDDELRACE